jgi:hypothetical protein
MLSTKRLLPSHNNVFIIAFTNSDGRVLDTQDAGGSRLKPLHFAMYSFSEIVSMN